MAKYDDKRGVFVLNRNDDPTFNNILINAIADKLLDIYDEVLLRPPTNFGLDYTFSGWIDGKLTIEVSVRRRPPE